VRRNGRVYADDRGGLWLDPGTGLLTCLDYRAVKALTEACGSSSPAEVIGEVGELRELADPWDLLPTGERYPLLVAAEGKTPEETLDLVLRVTGRARDADDARDLLEACGLRRYENGGRR